MKLLGADYVFTCNKDFKIIQNGGILFEDSKILEVGDFDSLNTKYDCNSIFHSKSIITPGFINSHVHLEFSKNMGGFELLSFSGWLNSVLSDRNKVLENSTYYIQDAINELILSGVSSIGAISSYDLDLDLILKSNLKAVYFAEVIGANEDLYNTQVYDLSNRLDKLLALKSQKFHPAIAIHSPYSVNKSLVKYCISLASKYNLILSTHFLESSQELEWLEKESGYFKDFYTDILKIPPKRAFSKEEFLDLFVGDKNLFTHCLFADSIFLEEILKKGHIISCPRSNILLSQKMGLNKIIATDGKSSNNSLNILDELRACFFASYNNANLKSFPKDLISSITSLASKALGLNNGILEEGRDADINVFEFPSLKDIKDIELFFILYAKSAKRVLSDGVDILNLI